MITRNLFLRGKTQFTRDVIFTEGSNPSLTGSLIKRQRDAKSITVSHNTYIRIRLFPPLSADVQNARF
jgi:hypothetical protein